MVDYIFREYDIRGKVPEEFHLEEVYTLGLALAAYFNETDASIGRIALGMDGRIHSQEIKNSLVQAFTASGFDVVFIGVCPTPVLYFALHTNQADAGLMITASHNGPEYNGIKICLGKEPVWGTQIARIRDLYKAKKRLFSKQLGTFQKLDAVSLYLEWLEKHFSHLRGISVPALIDCGNGVAGVAALPLFEKLNICDSYFLFADVDGTMPNHEADPTVEKNMEEVRRLLHRENRYKLGIGFDGDGDRMAPMTPEGYLVPGDKLLCLFAQQIVMKNPGASIVFDIKCSAVVSTLLNQWGGKPCISPSGHSIIKHAIKEHNALLAGELSCHFFFNDRYFGYDDGIYAMMRLIELLSITDKSLTALLEDLPRTFATKELRISCEESEKKENRTFCSKIFCCEN